MLSLLLLLSKISVLILLISPMTYCQCNCGSQGENCLKNGLTKPSNPDKCKEDEPALEVTTTVIFDMFIGQDSNGSGITAEGSVRIGLFGNTVPITTGKFIDLCNNKNPNEGYTDTEIHRVIPNYLIQGGDILNTNGKSGYPNWLIEKGLVKKADIEKLMFDNENCDIGHYGAGWVSMANGGLVDKSDSWKRSTDPDPDQRRKDNKDGTNWTQFFITLRATRWLDGKNTVFGKVLNGMDFVRKIGGLPQMKMPEGSKIEPEKTAQKVTITGCRVENVEKVFTVEKGDAYSKL